jgi:hypothetical protein
VPILRAHSSIPPLGTYRVREHELLGHSWLMAGMGRKLPLGEPKEQRREDTEGACNPGR